MNAHTAVHHSPTPWSLDDRAEERFKKILRNVLLATVIAALVVSFLPVYKTERPQPEEIPPAVAKLIVERQKQPPPPKVEPQKQKEQPKQKKEVKKEPPKKPKDEKPQVTARVRATQAFSAVRDALPALDDEPILARLQTDQPLIKSGTQSAAPKRDILVDETATATESAGFNPAFQRGAGNVNLTKRQSEKLALSGPGGSGGGPVGGASGNGNGNGGKLARSKADIQLYLEKRKPQMDRLYRRALRENPALQGQIVIRFTVLPNGAVTGCKIVSSELKDSDLENKLVTFINTFNFGALNVDASEFTYPMDFLPES